MYHNLAKTFQNENIKTFLVNYRLYPKSNINDMMDDLKDSFDWIQTNVEKNSEIFLCGHSSGAHMVSLSLMKNFDKFLNVKGNILLSGVFDIQKHYELECERGVEKYSGMKGAMINEDHFKSFSPLYLIDELNKKLSKTLIIHGIDDEVVPIYQSKNLLEKMKKNDQMVEYVELKDFDHSGPVMLLMDYGSEQRKSEILTLFRNFME